MHLSPVVESVFFVVFVFSPFLSLSCYFCHLLVLLEGFWGCCTWGFRNSLDDGFVVLITFSTHFFIQLQSVFSNQTTNLLAQSWRSQIAPDHLCLDETELIQAPQPHKYDKSCRSFQDGVGPCNQRFGSHNVCHDLSFDLSFVLSSLCHSRDLMLEIYRWVKVLHLSRAFGPVHAFHRHLLRPLRPLWHIHFQVVHPLHRAHPQCPVHQLKWHRPALHPFHHPSLVKLAPLMSIHLGVEQRLMTAAPMALIPILIGKRTKTITIIRKSTAWLFLVAFVNRPSRKNWTLRDVILWNCQWQPCYISRQTTFGFGSWLMGVKSTWFPLGTLQLLCSRRSFWHNSATRG